MGCWNYLSVCLSHYGIDPRFISWTSKYLNASYLTVVGNSFKTDPIYPLRGLCQGDPMLPILYNFAINPLLCHLEKLSGVLVRGQSPIKVFDFADDFVLGIYDCSNSHIASQIISDYKSCSQVKLSSCKSMAISKLNPPCSLPFNIKYTDKPVHHLRILVNSSGYADKDMEQDLLKKMQSCIAQWKYFQPY